MNISYESYAHFFENAQLILVVILFLLLSILIYHSSKIEVTTINDSALGRYLSIILIPLSAISFFFAFYLILQSDGITLWQIIKDALSSYSATSRYIVQNLPVWNFLYLLCLFGVTHQLKVNVRFKRRNTIVPEGING